jgi:hypothetical protein
MVNIGEVNQLTVSRLHTLGAFLATNSDAEVLLPKRYVPDQCKVGDVLSVFVYKDSDEQLVATTDKPFAEVGQVAWLKVAEVNKVGAFLTWGLAKDLLCPYGEQHQTMEAGKSYLVIVFLDDQDRIAASARIDEFLEDENQGKFEVGQEVSLIVGEKTPLGIKAVINHTHWGVLYENELFNKVRKGQTLTGYIKKIREDDRIDVSLQKPGYSKAKMNNASEQLLEHIKKQGGYLAMTDKTPPEDIYDTFGVSKKVFKQAIGSLYKQRLIMIEDNGLRLVNDKNKTKI